jgi:uncharacterized membrane protein
MEQVTRYSIVAIVIVLLLCIPTIAGAVPGPEFTTTYTITIQEDGTAVWYVEYRALLATEEDLHAFENYSSDLDSVYLPQFKGLMQNSAAQAEAATSRHMVIDDFSGDAVIQTSPTGRYGVVFFSFRWTNFAGQKNGLVVGDAFAGGLYLSKDAALIIRYPSGYTVKAAEPAPDEVRDGLIWYGLRPFGPGEPRLVLEPPAFPLLPLVIGCGILIVATAGLFVYFRKKRRMAVPDQQQGAVLSDADMASLEERIVQLLTAHGGELFQSEIVRNLGLPKSTVSSALNELHSRGAIQKVKRGRENLIRLT